MATIITISGLEIWTRIGISNSERLNEQRVLADITLICSGKAGESDSIEDTVNYEEIVQHVKMLAKVERKTLEKFATDIVKKLQSFAGVENITVTLKKFALAGTKNVSVTITQP